MKRMSLKIFPITGKFERQIKTQFNYMEGPSQIFSSEECVICMGSAALITFLPCRHCCTCGDCDQLVKARGMECPLCRGEITGRAVTCNSLLPSQKELDEFEPRRDEYLSRLSKPVAKNAGFVGRSKLARSVAFAIGNELEQRILEGAGGDRRMTKSVEFFPSEPREKEGEEETLRVLYKVGRKTHKESAPLISSWDQVLVEALETMEQPVSDMLELAIYYPELYWLCKWHKKNEEDLKEGGIIKAEKRRKK